MSMRNVLMALAGASLISSLPALAQGRSGGQGQGQGHSVRAGGNVGVGIERGSARGAIGTNVGIDRSGNRGVDTRARARANARSPERAATRAIERANENSVLSGTTLVDADLGGLSPGLVVRNGAGETIGTVSRVIRASDGTIRNVLVRARDGRRTLTLTPRTLSLSGDAVTTTSAQFD